MQPRTLALDVGDKRIGVAVSDLLGITAQPLETYTRIGYGPDVRHFTELAARYDTRNVLCGLPRNMDGSQGGQAEKVRAFAEQLEQAGLRVAYWDERLTTATAERALIAGNVRREQRKQKVDMVAAVVILQAYLDAGGPGREAAFQTEKQEKSEEKHMQNDQAQDVVELIGEDGETVRFEHLMTLTHEGHEYVMLTALEDEDGAEGEEGEVYILRIDQDEDGEDCYVTLEDEALMQAVFERFVALSEQDEAYDEDEDDGDDADA